MSGWDDDDDWVGEPPEGRYTRDRADPVPRAEGLLVNDALEDF